MTVGEYITAFKEASEANDVLALWKQAARPQPDGLSLKEIIEVHKACGEIVIKALGKISERAEWR